MFEAIGKATSLIKTVIKLKDKAEILEAIIPLQDAINDAQREATEAIGTIYSLTTENISLKEKLAAQDSFEKVREKYEVIQFPRGSIGLKLIDTADKDYPFICANCFEDKVKSPLHKSGISMECLRCKTRILTDDRPQVTFNARPDRYSGY